MFEPLRKLIAMVEGKKTKLADAVDLFLECAEAVEGELKKLAPGVEKRRNTFSSCFLGDARKIDAIFTHRKGFFLSDISMLAYTLEPKLRGARLTPADRRQALQFLQRAAEMAQVEV